jgi:hypothetical protein
MKNLKKYCASFLSSVELCCLSMTRKVGHLFRRDSGYVLEANCLPSIFDIRVLHRIDIFDVAIEIAHICFYEPKSTFLFTTTI